MAIRMTRFGEAAFGEFARGDVILNLSPTQESLLLEAGTAVQLENEDVAIALGGGGTGLATSCGTDLTAMTIAESTISAYTAGLPFSVTYPTADQINVNVNGVAGLTTVLQRIGTSTYFRWVSGPQFVSGRYRITAAQFVALMDGLDPANIAPGFAVAIIGIGAMIDAAGNTRLADGWKSHLGGGDWVWDRPLSVINAQSVTHNGTGAESSPLRTLPSIPMRMLGKWDKISCVVWRQGTGNTGTKVGKLFLNGSGSTNRVMQLTMNASASTRAHPLKKEIFHRGTTSEFEAYSFTNNGELTTNGLDSGIAQIAVNSATADLVFTYTETASAGDTVTVMMVGVTVSSEVPQLS